MKGAPPLVELLFNLCPICVIAVPILSILVMLKSVRKPDISTPMLTDIPPDEVSE